MRKLSYLAALRLGAAGRRAVHEDADLVAAPLVTAVVHAVVVIPIAVGAAPNLVIGRRRQGAPEDEQEHGQGVLEQVRQRPDLRMMHKVHCHCSLQVLGRYFKRQ